MIMENQTAELIAALAKAQGEFKPIEKNREVTIQTRSGSNYRFRYADLEEILTKTRPALSANGLALIQTVERSQDDNLLTCKLMHASGGIITSEVSIQSAREHGGDPKAFGAAITYFRRYLVTAMLGVAADDDLDEDGQEPFNKPNTAGQKPAVTQPQRRTPAPADVSASPAATQGEIAYIAKKIEASGMTIAQAREKAAIAAGESLEGITKADFAALKGALA